MKLFIACFLAVVAFASAMPDSIGRNGERIDSNGNRYGGGGMGNVDGGYGNQYGGGGNGIRNAGNGQQYGGGGNGPAWTRYEQGLEQRAQQQFRNNADFGQWRNSVRRAQDHWGDDWGVPAMVTK